jgi:hypothetical protein
VSFTSRLTAAGLSVTIARFGRHVLSSCRFQAKRFSASTMV